MCRYDPLIARNSRIIECFEIPIENIDTLSFFLRMCAGMEGFSPILLQPSVNKKTTFLAFGRLFRVLSKIFTAFRRALPVAVKPPVYLKCNEKQNIDRT